MAGTTSCILSTTEVRSSQTTGQDRWRQIQLKKHLRPCCPSRGWGSGRPWPPAVSLHVGGCNRLPSAGAHLLCPQSWLMLIKPLPEQQRWPRTTRSSGTKPAPPVRGLPTSVPRQLVPGPGSPSSSSPLTAQHRWLREHPALTGQPQGGLPPGHPRPGA